ncbi:MAG: general secretion pathway protein GspB [Gammaproteobacteria bacterium]|nr:general secretion pathway protein GspB [Gammaproteobacteria bacterium]
MSFILDALRRAEVLRGNQPRQITHETVLDEIAEPAASTPPLRLITVLLISSIVIAMFVIRLMGNNAIPELDKPIAGVKRMSQVPPLPGVASDTPLAEVVTPGNREIRPLKNEAVPVQSIQPDTPAGVPSGKVSVSREPLSAGETPSRMLTNLPEAPAEQFPAYQDLVLSGRAQLPVFHLDIHVYAPAAERRFVFVNNRKYREGNRLDEGGTVEKITPAGVILNHRGHRFELLPD